jgi:hypothetical protein
MSYFSTSSFVSISLSPGAYNSIQPPRSMKIELTAENAAALAKYAALAGYTPDEFLNRFRSDWGPFAMFVKKILSVSMILLALFSIPSICKAATIRGSVMEIHSGAGRASPATQVTVRTRW